jgi:hypothetical protein
MISGNWELSFSFSALTILLFDQQGRRCKWARTFLYHLGFQKMGHSSLYFIFLS